MFITKYNSPFDLDVTIFLLHPGSFTKSDGACVWVGNAPKTFVSLLIRPGAWGGILFM